MGISPTARLLVTGMLLVTWLKLAVRPGVCGRSDRSAVGSSCLEQPLITGWDTPRMRMGDNTLPCPRTPDKAGVGSSA
ncbi:uncharacterized protein B0H64DRAFT_389650 [Chaetomium fimeti]|uniref:Uncharacterized protein n=1 Tax=Chaetomium fimeti TaxID=1854472 RepID=A0AAE0LSY8_9PEZI|nr:hypothetical protein B0H64DRAFT_389650 [Chaetomium fimeti]